MFGMLLLGLLLLYVTVGGLILDHRSTFHRTDFTSVDGRDVAFYEGWVRSDDLGPTVLLLLPGERDPRLVTLEAGKTVHVAAARTSPP